MSYCEVSLTFNNSNQHIFPTMPFDEVVITRKLDRSGLSEYYINHNRVRMRDVISLFHDTGIGKEGYSIIGQGRVAEIMSAKPGDRRQIFEEAAGISKFRAQRTEAERKLEKPPSISTRQISSSKKFKSKSILCAAKQRLRKVF